MSRGCVDAFTEAIKSAGIATLDDVFSADAVVDATVPNWRFSIRGEAAIRAEFARWYADPGRFEELRRTPLPDGELVEYLLAWEEDGVPHASHQAHRLEIANGLIARDTVWCGGRWPASLLAEMEAAAQAAV
jgi:hypothetical protein